MSYENLDFNFDFDGMQQDLSIATAKPGQTQRSKKYIVFPKGEGMLIARILPNFKPNKHGLVLPYASTRLHYINGQGHHCLRELCPDGRWRGNCPTCDYYSALFEKAKVLKNITQMEKLKDIARGFRPIDRNYYNAIQRKMIDPTTGEITYNVGPMILSANKTLQTKILRAFCGNKAQDEKPLGNVAHPITGRDFKVITNIKKGERNVTYTDYGDSKFLEESVLGDEKQVKEWLDNLWDLEAERTNELKSYEEIKHLIDLVQGKAVDNSKLNPDDFSLPVDWDGGETEMGIDDNGDTTAQAVKTTRPTPVARPTTPKYDIPFQVEEDDDGDMSVVEDDWVKDLEQVLEDK